MEVWIERDYPLPLYLSYKEDMNDEELFAFCAANEHLRIERDEHKKLIIMAPSGGETGRRHAKIVFALQYWNRQNKLGEVFDSATGFKLHDKSMRSPDAAWLSNEKWNSLTDKEKEGFVPFAPDFLVAVLSPTDHLETAQRKMTKWIENGTRLAWLIAPKQQLVFIYRINGTVDRTEGFENALSGEDVLHQFLFDLKELL